MNDELTPQVLEPDVEQGQGVIVRGRLSDDNLATIAEQADKRVQHLQKIKSAVLKLTNNNDWVSERGKPFLQTSGAEKVARAFGISWKMIGDAETEFREDGHYTISYKAQLTFGNDSIEVIGTRSSYDVFFRKVKGKDPEPEEVDKANVKKAAYTNCIGNGITRMLGLRNLTMEELDHSGIRCGAKVDFDGENKSSGETKKAAENRSKILELLQELYESGFEHPDLGAEHTVQDLLKALTTTDKFKGWNTLKGMSYKGTEVTLKHVTEVHKDWMSSIS